MTELQNEWQNKRAVDESVLWGFVAVAVFAIFLLIAILACMGKI